MGGWWYKGLSIRGCGEARKVLAAPKILHSRLVSVLCYPGTPEGPWVQVEGLTAKTNHHSYFLVVISRSSHEHPISPNGWNKCQLPHSPGGDNDYDHDDIRIYLLSSCDVTGTTISIWHGSSHLIITKYSVLYVIIISILQKTVLSLRGYRCPGSHKKRSSWEKLNVIRVYSGTIFQLFYSFVYYLHLYF